MSPGEEIVEALTRSLAPYVRTRDEATHVRRVLALHLAGCLQDGSPAGPLALVNVGSVKPSQEVRGLQREYMKAMSANIQARAEHEAASRETSRPRTPKSLANETSWTLLEEHLANIKTRKQYSKLQSVQSHLDQLTEKPAAAPDFLEPEDIFKNSTPLPEVPKEVVNGLTRDLAARSANLDNLINQLERQVLRAKLQLRREEQLLDEVKSRFSVKPESIHDDTRTIALNSARNELIRWIETELAKAGDEAEETEDGQDHQYAAMTDPNRIEEQLATIQEKYAAYTVARKSLLQLMSQRPQPVLKSKTEAPVHDALTAPIPPSSSHLLSPYLERLLAVAHEQKGLITQKSHLSIAIAKQLKENCQILDHVAEESQLLPRHPVSGKTRRNLGLGGSLAAAESLDSSSRVKSWVFAADSAKIATLEIVAEKIEEGQLSMEQSMRTLNEVDRLTGRAPPQDIEYKRSRTVEDDIWLAQGPATAKEGKPTKHSKQESTSRSTDVWDTLDVGLGLLKNEDLP